MAGQGIRSTKTYIWYLKDVLGTGATSSVYLGRHKKTGDVVAVKMFNHMSYMRPQDVQQREFEVLLKLNHRNIIHLHAIEEDQISKQPVIVMEICTGGSLYTYLDTPENLYGLKEKEFLRVLKDVSAGMKHLRDQGIIHRDIKPGNIMMVKGDDGVFIYKLADFGAARELEDDEAFMSLYGTEEYLHPDVYERAVLGKRVQTQFTAQTDLWSLGVTFYHAVTGTLPFRAYGGRSNREIMHKITTTKKSGVISGVQETANGPITWSEDLPKTCHLSPDMRLNVKELLSNTMECNINKMWTFDHFFQYVQGVSSMRAIHVFVAHTCDRHVIYVEPNRELGFFRAKIAHLTGIQPDTQCLLWEAEVIDPRKYFKCEDLPKTSEVKPLILLRMGAEAFPGIRPIHLPPQPKTATHYNVQQDCTLAKNCAAVMFYYAVKVEDFSRIQSLISDTVRGVIVVLRTDYLRLRRDHSLVMAHHAQADCKMQSIQKTLNMLTLIPGPNSALEPLKHRVIICENRKREVNKSYDVVTKALDSVEKIAINDDYPSSHWEGIRQQHVLSEEKIGRINVLKADGLDTYKRFKKDKQAKQLSYNEEQIHRMDKEKVGKKMGQSKKLFDELFDDVKGLHNNFGKWQGVESETRRVQEQLTKAQYKLSDLRNEYPKIINELLKIEEDLDVEMRQRMSESISPPLTQTPISQESPRTADVTTSITQSMIGTSSLSGFMPQQSWRGGGTNVVGGASQSDSLRMSVKQLLSDLPINSLGMVPVPRTVKQALQQYETSLNQFQNQLIVDSSLSRPSGDSRQT